MAPWLDLYNIALFLEEEIPVLYVYELLLQPRVPGKGLGRFLMQLVELMAQKVMLICFSHLSLTLMIIEKYWCFLAKDTTLSWEKMMEC